MLNKNPLKVHKNISKMKRSPIKVVRNPFTLIGIGMLLLRLI